jgi:hypothetical protein
MLKSERSAVTLWQAKRAWAKTTRASDRAERIAKAEQEERDRQAFVIRRAAEIEAEEQAAARIKAVARSTAEFANGRR